MRAAHAIAQDDHNARDDQAGADQRRGPACDLHEPGDVLIGAEGEERHNAGEQNDDSGDFGSEVLVQFTQQGRKLFGLQFSSCHRFV